MAQWKYGIYADDKLTTACYIASVHAATECEAIARLKDELLRVPMPLYVGPLLGSGEMPFTARGNMQRTTDSDVILMKVS